MFSSKPATFDMVSATHDYTTKTREWKREFIQFQCASDCKCRKYSIKYYCLTFFLERQYSVHEMCKLLLFPHYKFTIQYKCNIKIMKRRMS